MIGFMTFWATVLGMMTLATPKFDNMRREYRAATDVSRGDEGGDRGQKA